MRKREFTACSGFTKAGFRCESPATWPKDGKYYCDRHRPKDITEQQREFLAKLPMLQVEAMRLGLPVTSRAINNAVKASGWEVAGDVSKAAKYAPNMEVA